MQPPTLTAFLALFLGLTSLGLSQPASVPILVRDVRVFDGKQVLEHRSVLIEGGTIKAIARGKLKIIGAEVIDGDGGTLFPGLFDAHVHVSANPEDSLGQSLSFGVTTVLDMFTSATTLRELKRIESADPAAISDVRTAGIGATPPGGHPTEMGGPAIPTITGPEQAQAFVEARIAEGSDYIKIIYDDLAWALGPKKAVPMLKTETLRALVEAAHKKGRLAVVHIGSEQQAREAILAGADGLAHMFTGTAATAQFGRLAASHHVFVIPTLATLYSTCGEPNGTALLADTRLFPYIHPDWRGGLQRPWPLAHPSCRGTEQGMRELIHSHVSILAGTDAPVPGTTYGASLHGELALLVRAGLTPVQALVSATSAPAHIFGLRDRGLIRPGMRADLVLVKGNPTHDIQDTRNIIAVWKRGVRVQRQSTPVQSSTSAQPTRPGAAPKTAPTVPPSSTARSSVVLQIEDLSSKFLSFYDAAIEEHADPERRWQIWKAKYDFAAVPPIAAGQLMARRQLDNAWSRYPMAISRIKLGSSALEPKGQSLLENVAALLGAEEPVRVRLIAFVGTFGRNAFSAGSRNGVPTIAIPLEDSDRQQALDMIHEFTHALQMQLGGWKQQELADSIFAEGLAMRAAETLLPGLEPSEYTTSTPAWFRQCSIELPQILSGVFPHVSDSGAEAISRFTVGDGLSGLQREAYCAGWFVVGRLLSEGLTFPKLSHMSQADVRDRVVATMKSMSVGKTGN